MTKSRVAALTLAGALVPVAASAANKIPNIDIWSGSVKHHKKDVVTVNHLRGQGTTYGSLTVYCTAVSSGMEQSFALSARGAIKNGKAKLKTTDPMAGTLTITGTTVIGHKAHGKVTWKVNPTMAKDCKGSGHWTGKYSLAHGG